MEFKFRRGVLSIAKGSAGTRSQLYRVLDYSVNVVKFEVLQN
jgi:hypothetical protein